MKLKRFASFALAGLMAASLAGCGSEGGKKDIQQPRRKTMLQQRHHRVMRMQQLHRQMELNLMRILNSVQTSLIFPQRLSSTITEQILIPTITMERTGSSISKTSTRNIQTSRLISLQIQTMLTMH